MYFMHDALVPISINSRGTFIRSTYKIDSCNVISQRPLFFIFWLTHAHFHWSGWEVHIPQTRLYLVSNSNAISERRIIPSINQPLNCSQRPLKFLLFVYFGSSSTTQLHHKWHILAWAQLGYFFISLV